MAKISTVTVSGDRRAQLFALTKKGQVRARQLTHAHILLQADAHAGDDGMAAALRIARATAARTCHRWSWSTPARRPYIRTEGEEDLRS
jgi:hypothetical protein